METQIYELLQEKYDILKTKYGENRILGVFAFGPVNYGTLTSIDEVIFGSFYLPTFEEFCFNEEFETKEFEHIRIRDFRKMIDCAISAKTNLTEALYTDFYLINPKYEYIYENLLRANRDTLSQISKGIRLRTVAQMGLLEDDTYSAYRKYIFCKLYSAGVPYEKCINPDPPFKDILWNLKNNQENYFTELQLLSIDNEVTDGLTEILQTEEVTQPKINIEALAGLRKGAMEILKLSFTTESSTIDFLNKTTDTEKKALKNIIEKIGTCGTVSVGKIVEESGISRPVYTNLFKKLKDFKIAEIKNQGVKGTFINIIDHKILSIDF